MPRTKATGTPKTRTTRSAKPKAKREKKRYVDGEREFKSLELLRFHLELGEHKKAGLIQGFEVPTVKDMVKNKHNAIKVLIDGILFDSKLESRYYIYLLKQKRDGLIQSFSMQPIYELIPRFQKVIDGKKKTFRKTEYIADFLITDNNNEQSIIDVKGQLTDVFKIKRKLFEYKFPELTLKLVKEDKGQWVEL